MVSRSAILVEHGMNVSAIESLNSSGSTVITLDFVAHRNLADAQITHTLIEDYFEPADEGFVDELIISKSTGWYKDDGISDLLKFENINLGWTLELLIFSYMAQIVKKFMGLTRLLEKERFDQIHCSPFTAKLIQSISPDTKLHSLASKSEISLHFESVEIPLKIGGRLVQLRTSKSFALAVKRLMDYSTKAVANSDLRTRKPKKRVLLLDFNISSHEGLVAELSKHFEVVLLNERKPVIWNIQSLRISKRLDCKIIRLKDFEDSPAAAEINRSFVLLDKNLEKLFGNDSYFESCFSVSGMTFWPAIKQNFISTIISKFKDAAKRLILAKRMFASCSIDKVIVMYPNAFEEKMILAAAEKLQIHSVILQHGYLPNLAYMRKYLPLFPISTSSYCKHAMWGSKSRDRLLGLGIAGENLLVTGSPRHDSFFTARRTPSNLIMFFDSFASEINFQAFDTRQLAKNERLVEKICTMLNNVPGHHFSVKLHPGQHAFPYSLKDTIKRIDAKIPLHQTEDSASLLPCCSLAIVSAPSTILLEAMIMKIPTIACIPDHSWDDEDIFTSGSSILVHTYEDFERNLLSLLNNKKFRSDLVSKGSEYIRKYFDFPGESSENMARLAG